MDASVTAHTIRQLFFRFFEEKGHHIVPPAPLVIRNDPSLLFTNAGMNQFKNIFLGNAAPTHSRVVNTQPCLRVSGKHNDLDDVGHDKYHHTLFEMLGNWSFGDFFKKEAIEWAWELLTRVYRIPADRLYVTVFGGDDAVAIDQESIDIWKTIVPPEKILTFGQKENFWEMGDTGPCGPSSEIHIDCRAEDERQLTPAQHLVNRDHPQVIELWNLVFMQFLRKKNGQLLPLNHRYVDTGMGLERLVRVLQGKSSNYDTDLFTPIIQQIEKECKITYTGEQTFTDISIRVISDHLRAVVFCIADGQLPENTGAGYVVKRILRRAVRYYYTHFQRTQPLMCLLVDTLCRHFHESFPHLNQQREHIRQVIRQEEENFLHTIDNGIKRIDAHLHAHPDQTVIPGEVCFELYDTYGFPFDLTDLIAREKGFQTDEKGFLEAMQKQKDRSQKIGQQEQSSEWTELRKAATGEFVGYEHTQTETTVLRYKFIQKKGVPYVQVVLAKTPFYAEGGGQAGDRGTITFDQTTVNVVDTQKENGETLHICEPFPVERIHSNTPIQAKIDIPRRRNLATAHTATHLLHAALREILGETVHQKGSSITEHSIRFDISSTRIDHHTLQKVQERVNEWIQQSLPITNTTMTKAQADRMGAIALFGEKYGQNVRVVQIGDVCIELCGGTHLKNTSDVGLFFILSESSVASGVRRIEAVSGTNAYAHAYAQNEQLKAIKECLSTQNPLQAVEKLLIEKNNLSAKVRTLEQKILHQAVSNILPYTYTHNHCFCCFASVENQNEQDIKKIAFALRAKHKHYCILLLSNENQHSHTLLLMDAQTADTHELSAVGFIEKHIMPAVDGKGGGNKTLAFASGKAVRQPDTLLSILQDRFLPRSQEGRHDT